jgi:predicted nucleic acid-binding Zn ribbon protein
VSRRALRPVAESLAAFGERIAPASTLAAVQACWANVVGVALAAHASPVGERSGVLEVACDESVWAAEIELMGPTLVAALNAALGDSRLRSLRVRADGARSS